MTCLAGNRFRLAVDDGGPAGTPGPDRGYGLIGLAERVSQVGGSLTAGPDPAGHGFRVEARLPLG